MITANIQNYNRYCINSDFETAFEYLLTEDLDCLPAGKTNINDKIHIIKDNYKTTPIGETFWESHEKYIDIQYIYSGREIIAYAPIVSLKEIIYHEGSDLKILKGPIQSFIHLNKNDFAIFFPEDAHMPSLNPSSNSSEVEKFVIKIKITP